MTTIRHWIHFEAGGSSVDGDEHYGVSLTAQGVRLGGQRARIDLQVVQQCFVAERDVARFNAPLHAFPCD